MEKHPQADQVTRLLTALSTQGHYSLKELVERLKGIIEYYQSIQLINHPDYEKILKLQPANPTQNLINIIHQAALRVTQKSKNFRINP